MLRPVAVLFVVAVILALGAPCPAAELLVPSEYATIQATIDAAADGDTVIIAPGTYTGDGNRDIDFQGKPITARGVDPNDPNTVEATVIDCEQQGRGFFLNGCAGATISGLTITNGYGQNGGGVYIKDSDVKIDHCVVTQCITHDGQAETEWPERKEGTDGGNGGSICSINSSLTLLQCRITENSTGAAGKPIYSATMRGGDGGGVYCGLSSRVILKQSSICRNTAGSGTYPEQPGGGSAGGNGGGICCDDSSSLEIIDTAIEDNRAGNGQGRADGGNGGGIYCASNFLRVTGSMISENTAGSGGDGPGAGGNGGDAGYGGGIYCNSAVLIDCILRGNMAGKGGDTYQQGLPGGRGGGLFCSGSLTMKKCMIESNSAGAGGGPFGASFRWKGLGTPVGWSGPPDQNVAVRKDWANLAVQGFRSPVSRDANRPVRFRGSGG